MKGLSIRRSIDSQIWYNVDYPIRHQIIISIHEKGAEGKRLWNDLWRTMKIPTQIKFDKIINSMQIHERFGKYH
jgi:hypothetical protein